MSCNSAIATALLICDLQNDFIDPKGAYGRAGLTAAEIAAVPARVKPFAELVRAKGGSSSRPISPSVPARVASL